MEYARGLVSSENLRPLAAAIRLLTGRSLTTNKRLSYHLIGPPVFFLHRFKRHESASIRTIGLQKLYIVKKRCTLETAPRVARPRSFCAVSRRITRSQAGICSACISVLNRLVPLTMIGRAGASESCCPLCPKDMDKFAFPRSLMDGTNQSPTSLFPPMDNSGGDGASPSKGVCEAGSVCQSYNSP